MDQRLDLSPLMWYLESAYACIRTPPVYLASPMYNVLQAFLLVDDSSYDVLHSYVCYSIDMVSLFVEKSYSRILDDLDQICRDHT